MDQQSRAEAIGQDARELRVGRSMHENPVPAGHEQARGNGGEGARKAQSSASLEIGDDNAGTKFQHQRMEVDPDLQAEDESKDDQGESSEQDLEQPVRLDRQDNGAGDVEVQFESQRPRWRKVPVRIGPWEDGSGGEGGAAARGQRKPGGGGNRRQQPQPIERKNSEGPSESEIQRVVLC